MSADLFAAFASPPSEKPPPPCRGSDEQDPARFNESEHSQRDLNLLPNISKDVQRVAGEDDLDDWGALESPEPVLGFSSSLDQSLPSTGAENGNEQDTNPDVMAWGDFEAFDSQQSLETEEESAEVATFDLLDGNPVTGLDNEFSLGNRRQEGGRRELTHHSAGAPIRLGSIQGQRSGASIGSRQQETSNVHPSFYMPQEPPAASNEDVLFDAEAEMGKGADDDDNDDDEFGDFEGGFQPTTEIEAEQKQSDLPILEPADDLLTLESSMSASFDHGMVSQKIAASEKWPMHGHPRTGLMDEDPVHSVSREDGDKDEETDEWEPFADLTSTPPSEAPSQNTAIKKKCNTSSLTQAASQAAVSSQPSSAPTNIPPPSLLLSLFPPLLTSFLTTSVLFNSSNSVSSSTSLKTRIQRSPSTTIPTLVAHIAHLTTLSYILAGRSLRWKRDNYLSQSLRIGPAASGRRGAGSGMKLTQVSRGESVQEDREVTELVRLYHKQVGRIRAAVGAANAYSPGTVVGVPDVAAAASRREVRTATVAEGGVNGGEKPCALCGLRREERVRGVDDVGGSRVEDSFGEWWVEFWGHKACKEFWEGNKEKLAQR
ncbi:MAG: hypothetical protein M1837_004333 [Sclerophora amabilis]|nr:MAG: hypothetical protein M1837_004333 [Sclerophora amabilis]